MNYAICHPDKKRHTKTGLCKTCHSKQYRETNKERINSLLRQRRSEPSSNFKQIQKNYYERNKEAICKKTAEYRKANPNITKNAKLKKTFGIDLETYNSILKSQDGVCAVCKQPSAKKFLAVDHCHTTNKIRGLLCANCNTALGLLKDSVEIIENLKKYLEEGIENE